MRPWSVLVGAIATLLVPLGCGGTDDDARLPSSTVTASTAPVTTVSATTVPVPTAPSLPPVTPPPGEPPPVGASRVGRVSAADGVVTWQSPVDGGVLPLPVAITSTVAAVVACDGQGRLHVQAFDLATGAERWRRELGGCAALGHAVAAGETIVVAQGASVLGLDAATGDERWVTPAFAGFVQVGASPDAVVVAAEREVVGLDPGSGTERWRVEGPTGGSMWPPVLAAGSAVLAGNDLAAGQPSSTLHALDAATGQLRWRQPAGGMVAPPPAVLGDLIVVQLFPDVGPTTSLPPTAVPPGATVAFDLATGAERWRVPDPGVAFAPLAADPVTGTIVTTTMTAGSSTGTPSISALAADGSPRWSKEGLVASAGGAGLVLATPMDGSGLVALDAATGAERWRVAAPTSTVTISGDRIVGVANLASAD